MEPLSLRIAVLSRDEALRGALARVCRTHGHALAQVDRLRDLRAVRDPDVLVLDAELPAALAVRAVHPEATIVLVRDDG